MTQREWTMQDYTTLLRRWRVLISILAVAGAILAYGVSRFLPNRYTSESTVLVGPATVPADYVKQVGSNDVNERLATMKQQILSRTQLEPVIRQFGLYSQDADRVSMDSLVMRFQKAIDVTPIRPLVEGSFRIPGFKVSVTWDNARTAQELCASITSMFIQEDIRQRQGMSEDTTRFLAQQLTEAKAKLDEQDSKLADFEAHHMGTLPDEVQSNLGFLSGLYSELGAATEALTRAQLDKNLATSTLQQEMAARQTSRTGKNPETFGEELAELQTQLATLQAKYTDDYPDVVKTKVEIQALQKKMAESSDDLKETTGLDDRSKMQPVQFLQLRAQIHADDQIIADKTKQEERIQEEIKETQARIAQTPAIEQQYKALTRDYQTALEFYRDLLNKQSQSAMSTELVRRQEGQQFQLLDPANLPDKPDFPNRPEFALGGLAGGFAFGLGLAFLLEMRDTSLRTERDVETSLQLPVLAMVPAIGHLSGKRAKKAASQLIATSEMGVSAGA